MGKILPLNEYFHYGHEDSLRIREYLQNKGYLVAPLPSGDEIAFRRQKFHFMGSSLFLSYTAQPEDIERKARNEVLVTAQFRGNPQVKNYLDTLLGVSTNPSDK